MWAQKQGGFTVIEVMLFLAISGLLFLVVLLGTGAMMRQIRFSDSARSAHSFVQAQYSDILSGVNPRDSGAACAGATNTAGASGCLLLGRLLRLNTGSDQIESYYVIATRIPNLAGSDGTLSDEQLIASASQPVVVKTTGRQSFDIPWGAQISASYRPADGRQANTYMLLRSPRSSRILSYTFNMSQSEFDALSSVTPYLTAANTQKATNYCLQGIETPGNPAMMTVAGGQGQNDIKLEFEIETTGNCN